MQGVSNNNSYAPTGNKQYVPATSSRSVTVSVSVYRIEVFPNYKIR
jgi:hypothetical protein